MISCVATFIVCLKLVSNHHISQLLRLSRFTPEKYSIAPKKSRNCLRKFASITPGHKNVTVPSYMIAAQKHITRHTSSKHSTPSIPHPCHLTPCTPLLPHAREWPQIFLMCKILLSISAVLF